MTPQKIKVVCPKCGANVDLSEAIQDELLHEIEERVRNNVEADRAKEISELQTLLEEKSKKLKESEKNELGLLKREQELEEKAASVDLVIAKQLAEERQQIAKQARETALEESHLKIKEYDIKMAGLTEQLNEMRRKVEQSSMQLQGEAGELDLEGLLRQTFTDDDIQPVGKGIRGADIIQRVQTSDGQFCGIIVWESKNTKNWSDRWISKLKEDQLTAKADLAVLVSAVLPEDVLNFACIDTIWVTGFPYAISLATALREQLVQLYRARRSLEGKDEKIEFLYNYLSGPEFRQRIEMIVLTFVSMKSDLESEKRAMTKIWGQRDKSIEKVITNISGMYGDLQGIIGAALPTIQALELPESIDDV